MKILNCTEFLPNCCKSFTSIGGPAGVERDVLSLFEISPVARNRGILNSL